MATGSIDLGSNTGSFSPSGSAGGDLSGTYPNPTVATVGGSTAANIHTSQLATAAAASAATASVIVARDANANAQFAALAMGHVSSGVDNVGLGTAASASASYPMLISRDNESAGTFIQVANPTASANATAGFQVATDSGNLGQASVYTTGSTVPPYISAFVVRPAGDTLHLTLMGGEQASGDIQLYTGGDFTSAGLAATFNADKTMTSIGGVILSTSGSRPAAGASYRGMMWVAQGGGGVADKLQVCLKAAGGSYSWVDIVTG